MSPFQSPHSLPISFHSPALRLREQDPGGGLTSSPPQLLSGGPEELNSLDSSQKPAGMTLGGLPPDMPEKCCGCPAYPFAGKPCKSGRSRIDFLGIRRRDGREGVDVKYLYAFEFEAGVAEYKNILFSSNELNGVRTSTRKKVGRSSENLTLSVSTEFSLNLLAMFDFLSHT